MGKYIKPKEFNSSLELLDQIRHLEYVTQLSLAIYDPKQYKINCKKISAMRKLLVKRTSIR